MRRFFAVTFLLGLLSGAHRVAASDAGPTNAVVITPDYLSALSEQMRTNHPALQAFFSRADAAAANVGTVRTWEDPMARVGGVAAREEMRADEGDVIYGVEQKLPLFGKPALARRVAGAELATETANAEYQFQLLRAELAKAAFRTSLASELIRIGEEDLGSLDLLLQTAEGKYRTGKATLTEVLQIENEKARRATQLQTDREQLGHERVSMNRYVGREPESPWPLFELPAVAGPVEYNQRLLNFALKSEPKIHVLEQQVKQAEATVDLTRRQRLPDVNVGLEARNYSGDGSLRQGMLVFSMNLPWVNAGKYRNEVKRDQAKLKASAFELSDYQSALREEVHLLTVRIDAARREALLYRDEIVPRSRSAQESARSAWEAGQGTFRDLLDARRMLLEARLMYFRSVSEQYQMMSELVLCCGLGDLGALSMIGAQPDEPGSGTKP